MKPLVIYHADCVDGFGAAFATWLKLGDEAEYMPMQYGKLDLKPGEAFDPRINYHKGHRFHPDNLSEREVYILDFSFSRETMDHLFANAKRIVWLDHHASAFKDHGFTVNGYGEPAVIPLTKHDVILDNNKSGAYLAWEYFHPGTEVPMLIKHIDDYDRWQFKIEGTKAFNTALWSYAPWNFEQWKREFLPAEMGRPGLSFEQTARYSALRKEGEAILRAHEQNVQAVVKGAAMPVTICFDFNGEAGYYRWSGLAANCPRHLTSDVGHELANRSGTFGLCWYLDSSGVVCCSLRSIGDYDVSAVARSFGGGGHRNAAGFSSDVQTLMGWLNK